MNNTKKSGPLLPSILRIKAETTIKELPCIHQESSATALLHELQVHQTELERQNRELLKANAALEESHNRYLELYDLAPVAFLTLTQEARIAEVNLTGAALFGLERNSLIQLPFSTLLVPEEVDRWHHFFATIIKTGGNHTAEFTLNAKPKAGINVRIDCLRVLREDPSLAVHLVLTDISQRKLNETQRSEQEQFFRLITESVDGFIAVLDTQGRRIYNNASYARLFGDRDLVGTDSFGEIHPDDHDRVKEAFCKVVETGVGQYLEYRFVMPDGSTRLMESRSGVIADSEGRTKRVVVVSNNVTERYEAEQKIHRLAFYDALTKLPNRLTLNDRLQQSMSASKRNGRYGAVMFLDLDNFKPVNDTYGHGTGDLLLIQTAGRITDCVREMDTVARFGGDEFVVLLGELDCDYAPSAEQARRVAEKIRTSIARPYLLTIIGHDKSSSTVEHHCTASIGVKMFLNHEQSEDELLRLADIAMYRAKEDGRNNIHFCS